LIRLRVGDREILKSRLTRVDPICSEERPDLLQARLKLRVGGIQIIACSNESEGPDREIGFYLSLRNSFHRNEAIFAGFCEATADEETSNDQTNGDYRRAKNIAVGAQAINLEELFVRVNSPAKVALAAYLATG
jgi:hypothetical protein